MAFPADLPGEQAAPKHRLLVKPFAYSAAKTSTNAAEIIQTMLTARLNRSTTVEPAAKSELTLSGDIVSFGPEAESKRGRGAAKDSKAVVGVTLRLVDTATGEVLAKEPVRGESPTVNDATLDAVTKIAAFLERRVATLPARPRQIEGRVADITSAGVVLALGASDGVLPGDRFEILKINGEIRDPATREVLDIDAVKVGEFVADTVRNRTAYGRYGGQAMWPSYATIGRGYAARLMPKE